MNSYEELNDRHKYLVKESIPAGSKLISAKLTDDERGPRQRRYKNIEIIYSFNNEKYRTLISGHLNK